MKQRSEVLLSGQISVRGITHTRICRYRIIQTIFPSQELKQLLASNVQLGDFEEQHHYFTVL